MAKYDLAIIGSGPGGYVTAIRAAQWGLKTLVIEKDGFLGGTCLHVGCIPTKVLLHHAEIYDNFKNAKEFGIEVGEFTLNWPAVLARKEKIVNKHAKGIEFLFRKNKVETMQGWGRWAGPGRVAVEKDGQTTEVEATNIMFATGSEARSLPGVEFDGQVIVGNREILKLPRGAEVAGDRGRGRGGRGVRVDLPFVWHGGHLARDAAAHRAAGRRGNFRGAREGLPQERHPDLHRGESRVGEQERRRSDGGVPRQGRRGADRRRRARADGRGPRAANRGHRPGKNAARSSSAASCTRGRTWKPTSRVCTPSATSSRACRNWRTRRPWKESPRWAKSPASRCRRWSATRIPNATYCEPQIGSIGLTERQAREAGHAVKIGKFPFLANSKATILGQHEGFIKVVAEEDTAKFSACTSSGRWPRKSWRSRSRRCSSKPRVDDMMFMVHAHPTVWEAMGDAFASVRGLAINI